MCGITGYWRTPGSRSAGPIVQAMTETLHHRGPDAGSVWSDEGAGLALGHRRLAIVDLSPAGAQPMRSACGRYTLAFNGEIYNHQQLRKELESDWRGHSDTETLLAAIARWGVNTALTRLVGMFAFAVWDAQARTLTLARDRLGEKPLYYGNVGGGFGFASELKALRAVAGFNNSVDRSALASYLRHNYVPAPYSIYRNIFKLMPGHVLELSAAAVQQQVLPASSPYWSAREVAQRGVREPIMFTSDEAAVDALDGVLRGSIRGQMVADVSLGAFLSGGVDSSAVVALMQSEAKRNGAPPVKTFSIGFNDPSYDEAPYAKAVAHHLGTEHTELYATAEESLAVIPRLATIYDEPFSDSSQIPTFLVSQMARQHVTVALSGDAGDELFCGYNRYFLAARLWGRLAAVPRPLRQIAAATAAAVPVTWWNLAYAPVGKVLPTRYRLTNAGDKIHKAARVLGGATASTLYTGLVSHWEPHELMADTEEARTQLAEPWPELPTLMEQMMLLDTVSYLPDDILTKVDRAAMAVSLETRVPFLDHRVVEFAWSLPMQYKVRNGQGKWLLRQLLYRYVPRTLIERPKMGFGIPLDAWLRGPLRDWAEALIEPVRLRREGYFDADRVQRTWAEHLSGKRNWAYRLWDVLMFQAWLDSQ